MTALLVLKGGSAVVSVALAAGLLARDHGLRANRLIAAFLLCNAWWASCEFALYQQSSTEAAATIYRAMSFGWIPLGVLCAHASLALGALEDRFLRRLIVPAYGAVAGSILLALGTDLVIRGAESTPLGWRAQFGPGMLVAYASLAAPLVGVLLRWREVARAAEAGGLQLLARIVFLGISASFVAGTLTAVLLPLLRLDAVGLTTTLVALVGLGAAWTLRRYGHSLISPEACAREILDVLADGVILVGPDGLLRDANRAFLRLIAARPATALGRPIRSWIPDYPFDAETREGDVGSPPRLLELQARDALRLPIVLSAPVEGLGSGRVRGRAHLVRDRREIEALQRQLVVSARLAAVGDLARAISSAIREPVLLAREELEGLSVDWATGADVIELASLEDDCREAIEEGDELIAECIEGIERVFFVVREVSGFTSGREAEPFAPHQMDRIVARACRIADVQAPPEVTIEASLDPEVTVLCHFAELERVVTNLLVNAIQAFEPGRERPGHVSVAVAAQGDRALLHVEDDGCGIRAEVIDRIFDPFFTTKPVGKGTGLGLAISYHIVRAHGGEIRVASLPGRGTSVAVELPRFRPDAEEKDGALERGEGPEPDARQARASASESASG